MPWFYVTRDILSIQFESQSLVRPLITIKIDIPEKNLPMMTI